jgi:hypothetical protein
VLPTLPFPDRRRRQRLPPRGELLAGFIVINETVKVVELGRGGFSAVTSVPVPVESSHEFRLQAQSGFTVTLRATVRYCLRINAQDVTRFVIGAEFDRQDRTAVRRTIDRLIEEATGVAEPLSPDLVGPTYADRSLHEQLRRASPVGPGRTR